MTVLYRFINSERGGGSLFSEPPDRIELFKIRLQLFQSKDRMLRFFQRHFFVKLFGCFFHAHKQLNTQGSLS